jgi:hypothetical protein
LINNTTTYTYTAAPYDAAFVRSETQYSSNVAVDQSGNADNYVTTTYQYPFDYSSSASAGVMGHMVSQNYVSPVISIVKTRTQNTGPLGSVSYYTDATISSYEYNPYFGTPAQAAAAGRVVPWQTYKLKLSVPLQVNSSNQSIVMPPDPSSPGAAYDKRLEYESYDSYGRPMVINHDSQYEVLSWSFLTDKLLAKTTTSYIGAQDVTVVPQSWIAVPSADAKTQGAYYTWGGSKDPFSFTVYGDNSTIVSFWAKDGNFTVEVDGGDHNYVYTSPTQTTTSSWQYYTVVAPTVGSGWQHGLVYLTGSAKFSDVSVRTGASERTSYGYDALMRLNYILDPTKKLRSFEYDAFNRLMNVRDQDNNILNHTEYHFKGQ